jgi:catechol 2,3-dioxygenase-like lactoylglutathione lyase family enzyme
MISSMSLQKPAGAVGGIDHVALPMQNPRSMITFYRALGLPVTENEYLVQVYIGNQMINFHRPEVWQGDLSLRATSAKPPCGDLCFVWDGSEDALQQLLNGAGVSIEVGPVQREGGRQSTGSSVYVRDPDGNLLEFLRYWDGSSGSISSPNPEKRV